MTELTAITAAGAVTGREKDGALLFAGIPYAAPPVGERRFRPPEPVEPWAGTRDATRFGRVSWQAAGALGGLLSGPQPDCDEDCLFLNVVTPALDDAARPVMVWIHGGGFVGGSGSTPWYKGTTMARRGDVVVVTINYRLGALGFLHLGAVGGDAYASSGLSGILDQAAALRWVHDNIAAFGGDPGNVTIFGESAGAMSVGTLLGLPEAAGLFHRAIAQSGAANNLLTTAGAEPVTDAFLDVLGTHDLEGVLAAPAEQVLAAQQGVAAEMAANPDRFAGGGRAALGLPFQPVVEDIRLPRPPLDAVRDGHAPVPLMVGTNRDEWNLFGIGAPPVEDDAAAARRLDRAGVDGTALVEAYRHTRPESSPGALWSAIMTDQVFRMPAIRLLEAQSAVRPDDIYGYWFTWGTPVFGGRLGSCHALEIPFVFHTMDQPGADVLLGDDPPEALSLTMLDAWVAFARSGDPNHAGLPETWPAYDADRRATLQLDAEVAVVDDPDAAERLIWEGAR
jgi:para-nitrobenzyl esterase